MKPLKYATSVLYTLSTNSTLCDAISVVRRARWWMFYSSDALPYSHSLLRGQYSLHLLSYSAYVSFFTSLVYSCVIRVYQAAKHIRASHDALANLLELIEQFVNRLEIYTKVTLERAMVELIVKMLVQLLHVLGLVTKEIGRKPLSKSVLADMTPN
jgi:hypothetical protein